METDRNLENSDNDFDQDSVTEDDLDRIAELSYAKFEKRRQEKEKKLIAKRNRKLAISLRMPSSKLEVKRMLYKAFQQQSYYKYKDLLELTNQPSVHLKKVLREYCTFNTVEPHKKMWSLKMTEDFEPPESPEPPKIVPGRRLKRPDCDSALSSDDDFISVKSLPLSDSSSDFYPDMWLEPAELKEKQQRRSDRGAKRLQNFIYQRQLQEESRLWMEEQRKINDANAKNLVKKRETRKKASKTKTKGQMILEMMREVNGPEKKVEPKKPPKRKRVKKPTKNWTLCRKKSNDSKKEKS